ARHTGKKEYAYPALETLARELGIKDTRTIVKYTKSLANKGLVVIEKLKGKSNRYYLKNVEKVPTLDVPSNKEVDTLEVPTSHVPTTPDVSTPPTSHVPSSTYMGCTPKKTNIKNTNKETTTKIDNINKIDPSSSSLEILEKDKIKQIKSALQMHGISVATCKNIMDLVYSKHIDLERIKAVLTVAVIKRWEDGAIYKALKENWIIENKKSDILQVKTNSFSEKKAQEIIKKNLENKERRDREIERKEKLREFLETLPEHKKKYLEEKAEIIAKEKYPDNIYKVMARTESIYEIIEEYLKEKEVS
ncbi:replication initiator protein A, partial [Fusobacterium varium]|uniref:replication initiator protein A n=1 Tax=Fusobacterium varium TaxID=856 RepID=UPI003F06B2A1